ncbi:tetratricopeptide repeat protein [Bartonella sp. DGB1]|uniref:tetratricopeptide repeat protein n=1 Tax=Bartonella sp. DGB1 TaxID=3239807 RepID=UPI003523DCE6
MQRINIKLSVFLTIFIIITSIIFIYNNHINKFILKNVNISPSRTDNYSGYILIGQVASFEQNIPTAINSFEQALIYQPNSLELKRDIFLKNLLSNNFEQALKLATDLINDPEVGTWAKLALTLQAIKTHDYDKASKYINFSDNLSPMEQEIQKTVESWLIFAKDGYDKAIARLFAKPVEEWNKFIIYNQAFYMAQLSNRTEDIIKYYQKITKNKDPVTTNSYLRSVSNYILLLSLQKKHKQAINFLGKVPDIEGNLLYTALYTTIAKQDEIPLLVTNSTEALSEFFVTLVDILEKLNIRLLPSIYNSFSLGLNHKNSLSLLYNGTMIRYLDTQKSIFYFNQITKQDLYYVDAQLEKAYSLSLLKEYDNALQVLNTLEKDYPFLRDLLILKAKIYIEQQNYDKALDTLTSYLTNVKKISTEDWQLYYLTALSYKHLKNNIAMRENYEKAIKLFPSDPLLLADYALALLQTEPKQYKKALTMAKKAYNLQSENGAIVDTLGWIYYNMKDYKNAQKYLEEALVILPRNATAQDHLGDLYWAINKKLSALYQWKQAKKLDISDELKDSLTQKINNAQKDLQLNQN